MPIALLKEVAAAAVGEKDGESTVGKCEIVHEHLLLLLSKCTLLVTRTRLTYLLLDIVLHGASDLRAIKLSIVMSERLSLALTQPSAYADRS